MEILFGIYLVIGIRATLVRWMATPDKKPIWMLTEKNPIRLAFLFTVHTLFWPLTKLS